MKIKEDVIVIKANKYKDWWISERDVIATAETIICERGYEVLNIDIKKIKITKHNYKWYVRYKAKKRSDRHGKF